MLSLQYLESMLKDATFENVLTRLILMGYLTLVCNKTLMGQLTLVCNKMLVGQLKSWFVTRHYWDI